jgi:hypothetical protein
MRQRVLVVNHGYDTLVCEVWQRGRKGDLPDRTELIPAQSQQEVVFHAKEQVLVIKES